MSDVDTAHAARALSAGPLRVDCTLELTGVLQHAEVAMRPLGDGSFVPAIKVELDDVGAGHNHLVAFVLYPRDQREKAEARAKTLRRGQQITVSTQLADVRLLLPAASLLGEEKI